MSPTFFSLGISSFIITWAITATGLPSHCWTSYVLPCFSVFFFCDHQKLWKEMWSITGLGMLAAALPFLYVDYVNLKTVIPLVCIILLIKAFSMEKMLFIGDECGELAKFACWQIALRFIPFPLNKMSWKGDWVYCSPYSRGPIRRNIQFYYKLVGKNSQSPTRVKPSDLNPFNFNFPIEKCNVVCKYFVPGSNIKTFGLNNTNVAEAPVIREESLGASSSQSQYETIAVTEGSSPQDEIVLEHHVQNQRLVNKVEAALCLLSTDGSEDAELGSFTFFSDDAGRVAEIGRAMMVLKEHQNLIFSRFHKKIGSRYPKAHATCYQFKEIFELILSKGYTLEKVSLSKEHACSISGTTTRVFLDIINLLVMVWMNYYQLKSSAPHSSLVAVIFMFAFFQLLCILLKLFVKYRKRCLYIVISTIFWPDTTDCIYLFLQRKCPGLTYCNQSYGRPYTQDLEIVCKFLDDDNINGVYDREEPFPPLSLFDVDRIFFDLRNVELELEISDQRWGHFSVKVFFKLKGDDNCSTTIASRLKTHGRFPI